MLEIWSLRCWIWCSHWQNSINICIFFIKRHPITVKCQCEILVCQSVNYSFGACLCIKNPTSIYNATKIIFILILQKCKIFCDSNSSDLLWFASTLNLFLWSYFIFDSLSLKLMQSLWFIHQNSHFLMNFAGFKSKLKWTNVASLAECVCVCVC